MTRPKVKVHVTKYKGEQNLVMRYVDPITGKQKRNTTRTVKRKEAERIAARWEDELNTGKFKPVDKITWAQFRDRFEDQELSGKSDGYFAAFQSAFNLFEAATGLKYLADAGDVIAVYEKSLKDDDGVTDNTARTYLKHLKAALNWAAKPKIGLLSEPIAFDLPDAAEDSMKGRPISDAEFQLMLTAIPEVVGRELVPVWSHYLTGLWLVATSPGSGRRRAWRLTHRPRNTPAATTSGGRSAPAGPGG